MPGNFKQKVVSVRRTQQLLFMNNFEAVCFWSIDNRAFAALLEWVEMRDLPEHTNGSLAALEEKCRRC